MCKAYNEAVSSNSFKDLSFEHRLSGMVIFVSAVGVMTIILLTWHLQCIFQLQALESFSQFSSDYLNFMQDLYRTNGSFRATLCGETPDNSGGSGGSGNGSGSNGSGMGITPQSGLGLLAYACGLSNFTQDFQGVADMLRRWGLQTNSSEDREKPKKCSELKYNITNRQGMGRVAHLMGQHVSGLKLHCNCSHRAKY